MKCNNENVLIISRTSLDDPGLEILTDEIQFSDDFSQVCSLQYYIILGILT